MAKRFQFAILIVGILLYAPCRTYASKKTYQIGTIVSAESQLTSFSLSSGLTISAPNGLHKFAIAQGDVLYVGTCLEKDYREPKWKTGDTVEFRRDRDRMYLKKTGRGELELHFLVSVKLDANGKPSAILDSDDKK
jgi:hypothetical protein